MSINVNSTSTVPITTSIQTVFNIEYFSVTQVQWSRWVNRLEGAFTVFGIPDELKTSYILHYMGSSAYDVLCDKLAPEKPTSKTYAEIVEIMLKHYSPEPLEIAENFRFHQRKQKDGESLQDFISALQKLAINCKFGPYLKTALRNQFVFGLKSERIQGRLLETKDLNFDKALDIAIGMELSASGTAQLHGKQNANVELVHGQQARFRKKKTVANKSAAAIPTNNNDKKCYRCGKNSHLANKCNHMNTICRSCGTRGHLQSVCFKAKSDQRNTDQVEEVTQLYRVNANNVEHMAFRRKLWVSLLLCGKPCQIQLDSGAAVSIMSKSQLYSLLPDIQIFKSKLKLVTFCQTEMTVMGYASVKVKYNNQIRNLNLYIIEEDREALMGREWIRQFKMNWSKALNEKEMCHSVGVIKGIELDRNVQVESLLQKYKSVFEPGIGKISGIEARLETKSSITPIYMKARPVPFALQAKVAAELHKLVGEGVLEKVDTSLWATPIVPVQKANGEVRICGDFKVTVNPSLIVDEHPLPSIDELFATMAGGEKFTKIDLSQAYLHLPVRTEDQPLLTLNTHKGLYRPTRLMFGIASAPAIWQREIEKILQGIDGVTVFLDDIKVTGPNDQIHLQRLEAVLQQLQKFNLKVNKVKSVFFMDKIQYCGYEIDKHGIHRMPSKVKAIQEVPRPKNKSEIRAFVGLVNYYGRFFKGLSTLLYPLNGLLKNVKWNWDRKCESAFKEIKERMQSADFLIHFDPKLPIILATDASPYGVGAVLSHLLPDGTERPIQFASQTLTTTQQKYSQIDKEAYAIVFGVRKFFQYLFGTKFTLVTDHKPLVQIFSPTKGLPVLSATRMQHYAVFLQAFNYEIRYKSTTLHGNADAMSRLPLASELASHIDEPEIVEMNLIDVLPVTVSKLASETAKDKVLLPLLQGLKTGQQILTHDRFGIDQSEFSLHQKCIVRGQRVIIPKSLQNQILQELHDSHFGVVKMKSLARSYCWWQGIDSDIEELARTCMPCNQVKRNPPKIQNHVWEAPAGPFERVHADFAGPFHGHYYFILVDAFSKWPEIYQIGNITTATTIERCRSIFATFGLPRVFVSDNGTQFTSGEFQSFLKNNGIRHKRGAPYHPATNGQVERFVGTLKQALRTMKNEGTSSNLSLNRLLMQYRTTPHVGTGQSPSMLLMKREIRSRLNLMIPDFGNGMSYKGELKDAVLIREIPVGNKVTARDYLHEGKWEVGQVQNRLGNLHYTILLDDGRVWKRHIDQLRDLGVMGSETKNTQPDYDMPESGLGQEENSDSEDRIFETPEHEANLGIVPDAKLIAGGPLEPGKDKQMTIPVPAVRRSVRKPHAPDRLNL